MYQYLETEDMDALSEEMDEFDIYADEDFLDYEGFEGDELEDFLEEAIDEALDYGGRTPLRFPPTVITVRPAFVLDRFAYNRDGLMPHHRPQLMAAVRRIVASWRTPRPITAVRLVGHTDSSGAASYNRTLGQRRAQTVQRELMRIIEGLSPGLTRRIQFVPQSLGESRPVASNQTPTGRARNRRVEIFFMRSSTPRPPSSRSCQDECEREFQSCFHLPRIECLRRRARCLRNCRGVPV